MKKYIINSFLIGAISASILAGCKKSDFDDNYNNPEKTVNSNVEGLFAGIFDNARVMPRYWNLYTFQIPMLGAYSQTIGYSNGSKIYEQAINYTQDRWNDYYTGSLARLIELEKKYNTYEDGSASKEGYQLFLEIARIFVYDQTSQLVDMWGDIPFSTAGQLNATGGNIILASYDTDKDIYSFIASDLKRIADYLSSVSVDPFYTNQLAKSDYVNDGSILKWRKYCNSLRLRLAMRTSFFDEAGSKATVQEILGDPSKYPVVDDVNETIQIAAEGSLETGDMESGFGINSLAPGYMVEDIMNPSNDPRLPVMFSTNKKGEYHGVINTWTNARQTDSTTAGYYSRYDSVTFIKNRSFPGIILTAAEVSFIKAEAYERWSGGDAKAAYEQGIRQSIDYYYYLNHLNKVWGTHETAPAASTINAFLADPIIAYGADKDENLKKIGTQKWIDFGIMQSNHAWAEYRRTKYPELNFPTDASSTLSPNPPVRFLYPSTERILNAENYGAVSSKDNVTTKVFWQTN
ncbi:MAG: SusD/RagB family nutrient-binding outer membrane lipoprotein [Chitinophagaceae bacterium]|nr:SusD/RagB family nutrient-binding outer membrane lipoprotein [Chitinophagaceae bacterium]